VNAMMTTCVLEMVAVISTFGIVSVFLCDLACKRAMYVDLSRRIVRHDKPG
jgi:hypothetical protein